MDALSGRAFLFGVISAASLPLGALAAMRWTPRPRVLAGIMAFGGGALLAALSLDLVGDAVRLGVFYPLAAGSLIGSGLFAGLNYLVNSRGGFLRSAATTVQYLSRAKTEHVRSLATRLSAVPLFQQLPPRVIADLLPQVQERTYRPGTTIIRQDEPGDSFFVIEQGEIDVIDDRGGGYLVRTLGAGDVFGELALLTGEVRSASAVAKKDTRVWVILKEQFDRLLESSPALAQAVRLLAANRVPLTEAVDARQREIWAHAATRDLEDKMAVPTEAEVREAAHASKGAALITVDDVIDAIVKEQTEDVQKLGGLEALDEPYTEVGFFALIRKRAGWLCALFLSEMLTASAMQHFADELSRARPQSLHPPDHELGRELRVPGDLPDHPGARIAGASPS